MISIAECRAVAARKLELAVLFPERRQILTASSRRWAGLAGKLQAIDAATIVLYRAVMATVDDHVTTYHGHDYSIVESGNPPAWKWTVQMHGQRDKAGYRSQRRSAEKAAELAIDDAIAAEQRIGAALGTLDIDAVRDLITEIESIATRTKH